MPCVGDASEFCGAANAIQIYQNSAAAPVNFSSCITGRSLSTFSNIQLQAILKTGPYFPIQIYATTLNLNANQTIQYTILSVSHAFLEIFHWFRHILPLRPARTVHTIWQISDWSKVSWHHMVYLEIPCLFNQVLGIRKFLLLGLINISHLIQDIAPW